MKVSEGWVCPVSLMWILPSLPISCCHGNNSFLRITAQKGPKTFALSLIFRPKAVPSLTRPALSGLGEEGSSQVLLGGSPCSVAWRRTCSLFPVEAPGKELSLLAIVPIHGQRQEMTLLCMHVLPVLTCATPAYRLYIEENMPQLCVYVCVYLSVCLLRQKESTFPLIPESFPT